MISHDVNFNEDCFGQKVIQEETKRTPVLQLMYDKTDEILEKIPDQMSRRMKILTILQ